MTVMDLNCDLGESFGAYRIGMDAQVLPLITSANIACGWHAGDPRVMDRTVSLAVENGVGVGAHPGYQDLRGFGRRDMRCSPLEVRDDIIYQIGALQAFCAANGARLRHVKPHGALYNTIAREPDLARAAAEAIARVDPGLIWVTLAGPSAPVLARIGQRYGLKVVLEAFPDRAYTADGALQPRGEPGAVISDPGLAAERAVRMAVDGEVVAVDGSRIDLSPGTLCVHGDNPEAVSLVKTIRRELERAGVTLQSMGTDADGGVR
jgi:UPF0271 protein